MSFADEKAAVEVRFQAQFPGLAPGVAIAFDGVEFDPAVDSSWVTCSVLSGLGQPITLGAPPVDRYVGIIQNLIYTRDRQGSEACRDLADLIAPIWRRAQFGLGNSGVIRCRTPSFRPLGVSNGRYVGLVETEYFRDIVSTVEWSASLKTQRYIPTGAINGVNTVYTFPLAPDPLVFRIFHNGLLLLTSHYSLVGLTVTLTFAPATGDNLVAFF